MAPHPHPHRISHAVAVALAGLALTAPASIARPLQDAPVREWPHTAESRAYSTETAPALASRDKSSPRPEIRAESGSNAGFDWTAAAIGAAGAAGLIALAALGTSALATRRRPRTAA
jgi:hypothetical protein